MRKAEVNDKMKGIVSGNFYISDIANFRKMGIEDIGGMVGYLQQLILYVTHCLAMDSSELSHYLSSFTCDEIHDLISTTIMCVISLRRDNELQLRRDKLGELQPIEKRLNGCLRKLSEVSNFISAHAIYSLEGEYIPYQEELMLKANPYYSTL
jgi:hypothetical protein